MEDDKKKANLVDAALPEPEVAEALPIGRALVAVATELLHVKDEPEPENVQAPRS